jgi:hypothetical protein
VKLHLAQEGSGKEIRKHGTHEWKREKRINVRRREKEM